MEHARIFFPNMCGIRIRSDGLAYIANKQIHELLETGNEVQQSPARPGRLGIATKGWLLIAFFWKTLRRIMLVGRSLLRSAETNTQNRFEGIMENKNIGCRTQGASKRISWVKPHSSFCRSRYLEMGTRFCASPLLVKSKESTVL